MTMGPSPITIGIHFNSTRLTGKFVKEGEPTSSIWERMQQAVLDLALQYDAGPQSLEVTWAGALTIVGQFATQQKSLEFRFAARDEEAKKRLAAFVAQFKKVQSA